MDFASSFLRAAAEKACASILTFFVNSPVSQNLHSARQTAGNQPLWRKDSRFTVSPSAKFLSIVARVIAIARFYQSVRV